MARSLKLFLKRKITSGVKTQQGNCEESAKQFTHKHKSRTKPTIGYWNKITCLWFKFRHTHGISNISWASKCRNTNNYTVKITQSYSQDKKVPINECN